MGEGIEYMEAHLRAARDAAEQAVGRLTRELRELSEHAAKVRADRRRILTLNASMAEELEEKTLQIDQLIERVMTLEGAEVETKKHQEAMTEAAVSMMEEAFAPWRDRQRQAV